MTRMPSSPSKTNPVAGTPAQLLGVTALSPKEVFQAKLHEASAYSHTWLESRNEEST